MNRKTIIIIIVSALIISAAFYIAFMQSPKSMNAPKKPCGCGRNNNQALNFISGQPTNYKFN